jgi:hypothetical protein
MYEMVSEVICFLVIELTIISRIRPQQVSIYTISVLHNSGYICIASRSDWGDLSIQ